MQFSTSTLLATVTLLATSSARIIGLSAPSTIAAGIPFTISLLTEDYIQTVYDVGFAVGITTGVGYPQSLGQVLTSASLSSLSNLDVPLNFTVTVPSTFEQGPATLGTSVMSLYGVENEPSLGNWNVSVTVGDSSSAAGAGIVTSTS